MGITIHYEGRLKGIDALAGLAARVREASDKHEWVVTQVDAAEAPLYRVIEGEFAEYLGPVKGFTIVAHVDSEPVRLLFDSHWYMQEFTETQSCPASVHVAIVRLLRAVEGLFEYLDVHDEGQYWETEDLRLLEERRAYEGARRRRQEPYRRDRGEPSNIPDVPFDPPSKPGPEFPE